MSILVSTGIQERLWSLKSALRKMEQVTVFRPRVRLENPERQIPSNEGYEISDFSFSLQDLSMNQKLNWSEFISQLHVIFTKIELASKGGGTLEAWYGKIKTQRKRDPLLSYMHHARNADHHGLQNISNTTPGTARTMGEVHYVGYATMKDGSIRPRLFGDSTAEVHFNVLDLVSVTDRGVTYRVPDQHLGVELIDPSPLDLMRLASDFIDNTCQALSGKAR